MDPDVTVREMRALIDLLDRHLEDLPSDNIGVQVAAGLATKFQRLDGWLRAGGYLPTIWREPHRGRPPEREPLGPPDPAGVDLPEDHPGPGWSLAAQQLKVLRETGELPPGPIRPARPEDY